MPLRVLVVVAGIAVAAPAAAPGRTSTDGPATILVIAGDVETPLALSHDDVARLPRTRVEVAGTDGTATYEGVRVAAILEKAGVPLGSRLHGDALATCVLAGAADGYRVVFSIAELDPALTTGEIIIADRRDGAPLAAGQGPLRLVVPGDRRAARAVRGVSRLDVIRVRR